MCMNFSLVEWKNWWCFFISISWLCALGCGIWCVARGWCHMLFYILLETDICCGEPRVLTLHISVRIRIVVLYIYILRCKKCQWLRNRTIFTLSLLWFCWRRRNEFGHNDSHIMVLTLVVLWKQIEIVLTGKDKRTKPFHFCSDKIWSWFFSDFMKANVLNLFQPHKKLVHNWKDENITLHKK